jgi:hypothetical protein
LSKKNEEFYEMLECIWIIVRSPVQKLLKTEITYYLSSISIFIYYFFHILNSRMAIFDASTIKLFSNVYEKQRSVTSEAR